MVTAIEGAGTSEDDWVSWWADGAWPAVRWPVAAGMVVAAPHPDDEVLGVGGLMAVAGTALVVAVTDGEASHPGATSVSVAELRERRPAESAEALRRLGVQAEVCRLRYADGAIDEQRLADELATRLVPGDVCLATWRGDRHPDHEAVGRAAARAARSVGATLWEFPVWAWHWARPGAAEVPWHRAAVIHLSPDALVRKAAAIAAFRTQVTPIDGITIVPEAVQRRFRRPFEVVFR